MHAKFRLSVGLFACLQGGLRVVEIESVDINACGGTHLASLAEIQVRAPRPSSCCLACHCR